MTIRPIANDADHRATLMEIDRLWGSATGTPDGDHLDVLIALTEAYEARRWTAPNVADPVDVIVEHMRMCGYQRADLSAVLGSAARASEILSRKRALTLAMIRRLSDVWGIPADLLVRPYPLNAA
ncbi:MAG: transcriptional regulator [Ancalomicrobiaceae bacterium]|nr:transcriptional regulator [Ancalomicrobiaceae bacterium]